MVSPNIPIFCASSGFLIYLIPAMLFEAEAISKLFVVTTFVSGTAATLYIVLKGARTTAEVWARGGLVWAVEWTMAAVVPIYVSWLAFRESGVLTWGSPQATTAAEFGGWIAAFIGIGICLFFALTSYALYVIASRSRRLK
jgi:hypothetical protein